MKWPDEYDRKHKMLRAYRRAGVRYTPALTNRQWMVAALVADLGWLVNLIFLIAYFVMYGFVGESAALPVLHVLVLLSVACIQAGYGYVIYLSCVGEKEQERAWQRRFAFGLPSVGALAAAVLGAAQAVCSAFFVRGGVALLALAAVGAAVCFVGCFVIYRSFVPVIREKESKEDSHEIDTD